ncbi:hypothetical protein [Chengkuizengella marina]|uniref:SurA N-terminal domain-containing protein n=1 Tax=Chengkuizengella marina TaxID=2507566 RepID=A0A6N9Q4D4_9BACL|nr:hypothetical protein [Chengkuizengella marina]NBI29474.1 hypothetical protein [Chengkuizengella marina]
MLKSNRNLLFALFVIFVMTITGCTHEDQSGEENQADEQSFKITIEFQELIEDNAKPAQLYGFIDEQLEEIPREVFTNLLLTVEDQLSAQMEDFSQVLEDDEVQLKLEEISNENTFEIEEIQDEALRKELTKIIQNGYKIELLKGIYSVKIDYSQMEKYKPNVTEEMSEYMNIQAKESSQLYEKDLTLTIPWEELSSRLAQTEKFLTSYPESVRASIVERMYLNYLIPYLQGLPNSPAYDIETKQFNQELIDSYTQWIETYPDSRTTLIIKEYLHNLEETNYKYSNEVATSLDKLLEQNLTE